MCYSYSMEMNTTATHIPGDRCPKTGRSASACDSADHRNCPDLRSATLRYEDSKIVVAPIDHYVGPRLARTTWFAGLAFNEPGAEIQIRCPHTVKGHATTDAAVACGQTLARRLPGAPAKGALR